LNQMTECHFFPDKNFLSDLASKEFFWPKIIFRDQGISILYYPYPPDSAQ
jgi:hypothetical protein